MPLNKNPISINFAKGVDSKSDPYQLQPGSFSRLVNGVFDKVGRLTKRNGFSNITTLPNTQQTTLTTLNNNLIATGSALYAYSKDTSQWLNKGSVQPVSLSVLPLVRVSTSQTAPDSITASNGLVCLVYMDGGAGYYQISDSSTGQQTVARTALPGTAQSPRVFLLGNYFAITYVASVAGTPSLQVKLVSVMNGTSTGTLTVSSVNGLSAGYDGAILGGQLYLAYSNTSTSIQLTYITTNLAVAAPITIAGKVATVMSVSADIANSMVWLSFWDATSTNGFTAAYSQILAQVLAPTQIITGKVLKTITSVAQNLKVSVFYEVSNTFSAPYPTTGVQSDFINGVTCTSLGAVVQQGTIVRSVGLASKAFIANNGNVYMLAAYGETNQPTYFLMDASGAIYMRLAYSNGGGFATTQVLPNVSLLANGDYSVAYLIKDFLAAVNKNTGNANGTPSNAIYTQTGVNLATFGINSSGQYSSEIAGALHLTGGQLWEYDGVRPVEHGFHVWPEDVASIWSPSSQVLTTGTVTNSGGGTNTGIIVASPAGIVPGQLIYDLTTPANISPGTTVVSVTGNTVVTSGTVQTFTGNSLLFSTAATFATFDSGSTTLSVNSSAGLTTGSAIADTSSLIPAGTTITAINGNFVTISQATTGAAGDSLFIASTSGLSAFSSGAPSVTVSGAGTLAVGMYVYDATNPGNITPGTIITNIVSVGPNKSLFLSQKTAGASTGGSGDSLYFGTVLAHGTWAAGGSAITASTVTNVAVGNTVFDLTTTSNVPANTAITAISGNVLTVNTALVNTIYGDDIQSGLVAQPSQYVAGSPSYYNVFTYEWTDNQGNLHRSAPSIPVPVVTSGVTGTITSYVPTLRLTYKVSPNPVRIVGYRWSVAQQTYYQFTSITSPVLNDPTVDYVTIVDTKSDSQILGNTLLYTTGGVIEDIAAPACTVSALFKNRLILVDAEDPNLLWYSKQVIEGVPVEMSDLLTIYVAPTSGAQGSTGPVTALSAMDDKLIIFKRDAIYYLTGTGPDNTGASNDFSDPVYITSSVGCANPASVVLMPNGIMFQSDKGIWILGRDLSTNYIGAAVEDFNGQTVVSAQSIPATNQVRFILDDSTTLMYDYFVGQWGTFTNISGISATLYSGSQTYLNAFGQVFQETAGMYLDGSSPVLLSLTSSWINLAGLQGFERFYEMDLLGTFHSPFKLNVELAYDYNPSSAQATIVTPNNYSGNWGGAPVWGSPGGWSKSNVFEARVFPIQQKCESFMVTITEVYDSASGVPAGEGLSLSGLLLMVGGKKGVRTQKSAGRSFG